MKSSFLKTLSCAFACIISTIVSAQVAAVKFIVHVPEPMKASEGVYIAGSFNYWHVKDSLYQLKEITKEEYSITVPVFETGQYQYKYTLGDWTKVEVTANDSDISNRRFTAVNGKIIKDTVLKWKQQVAISKDSSQQLKKIAAMKDSLVLKLKPEMNEMLELFKQYVQNMLNEKPDKGIHEKLDENAVQKIKFVYTEITNLLWNVCLTLSAEQKQEILKKLEHPANGDFFNSFFGAVNTAVK
jgi:hypothetical protein